ILATFYGVTKSLGASLKAATIVTDSKKRLTERWSDSKEESVLCMDDLRFVETHASEESVVSVSGSSFENISSTRMLSGSFSSKLVVVVLLSAIKGSLFSGWFHFQALEDMSIDIWKMRDGLKKEELGRLDDQIVGGVKVVRDEAVLYLGLLLECFDMLLYNWHMKIIVESELVEVVDVIPCASVVDKPKDKTVSDKASDVIKEKPKNELLKDKPKDKAAC
ncbi:hypothetical protein Tco_1328630, partial [Tanacetum coccineum]